MFNWKWFVVLGLIISSYLIGFFLSFGWIGSILFSSLSLLIGSFKYGGTWKDLLKKIFLLFKKTGKKIENDNFEISSDMGNVAIGLSGGVDSAVAAHILKEQGYNVTAFFMRNWHPKYNNEMKEVARLMEISGENNSIEGKCQASLDYEDAKLVADHLGIRLIEINFVKEYWEEVFSVFLDGLKNGITPNPDIVCNSKIKFGKFVEYIRKNYPEMQYIATGHYADILVKKKKSFLHETIDTWKDQTYFLAEIEKDLFPILRFPLGKMEKKEVREIARETNIPVADKKDSTGICFIGKRNFQEFISNYIEPNEGNIIDIDTNEIVSKHKNTLYYTIGQRKGLNIGGSEKPYFVAKKDIVNNIVYVAQGKDHPSLYRNNVSAKEINLLVDIVDFSTKDIEVKLRHSNIKYNAKIEKIITKNNKLHKIDFKLDEKVFAITSGQELVMYKNGICLGGGKIV